MQRDSEALGGGGVGWFKQLGKRKFCRLSHWSSCTGQPWEAGIDTCFWENSMKGGLKARRPCPGQTQPTHAQPCTLLQSFLSNLCSEINLLYTACSFPMMSQWACFSSPDNYTKLIVSNKYNTISPSLKAERLGVPEDWGQWKAHKEAEIWTSSWLTICPIMEISHYQSPSDHNFNKERETAYSRKVVESRHDMRHRHLLNTSICLGLRHFKGAEEKEGRGPGPTEVHPARHSEEDSIASGPPAAQTTGTPPTESKITKRQPPWPLCGRHWDPSYPLCLESPSAIGHGHHISTGGEFPKRGQNFTAQFTDCCDDYGMS